MTTAYVYPGASGSGAPATHVARLATDALQVSFTRDVTRFALNKYAQIKPVKVSTDYFQQLDLDQPARLLSPAGSPAANNFGTEHAWPRGTRRPSGVNNLAGWTLKQYRTQREAFSFVLDLKDEQEADWNVVAQNGKSAAQQAMTRRSWWAANLISTAANFGSNTGTATALGGGLFSAATSSNLYIFNALMTAVQQIALSTNAVVQMADLQMVVNPNLARVMAGTDEIHNYLKGSYDAKEALQMGLGAGYGGYGLPPVLYGVKVVIEDAVVVTTKKGSNAQSRQFVLPNTVCSIVSRVGELVDAVTEQSFSTLTIFEKENLTVETKTDQWDRIVEGSCVDDIDIQVTAGPAGYLITACQ